MPAQPLPPAAVEAVIIAQGDELTTGVTVDTNSNWLCDQLWGLGVPVRRVICAPDRLGDLVEVLQQAAALGQVVLCSGGLGPTRDDLTAEAAGLAFDRPLALREDALAQVIGMYQRYKREMPEVNRKQAVLPAGATLLENRWGTAPGFHLEVGGAQVYFMPGVPREMKPMFQTWVAPDLRARLQIAAPFVHTIRVVGLGESELETLLLDLESPGMEIGYRTAMPENHVKLKFVAHTPAAQREAVVAEVRRRVGWRAFGVDCGDLAEVVAQQLVEAGQTIALAESCTAGGICAWLGAVPGVSAALLEGAVVYSNEAKTRTCGVDPALIAAHGAVSREVAVALAEGIRARAGATWGLGVTGIAGPGGGSPDKPVGTVHVALAGPAGVVHRALKLPGDRPRVQRVAAATALSLLLPGAPRA
ncbi:MAG: CinA family nicotinamide mononucleotide deamidase-related protein [Deltaproteobacteria bacterium]|nr:CinA family nicotinamide mononucleotide deamidase-related protein [Deltaproteobacteria bacterium]